jgi:hypothetical protein
VSVSVSVSECECVCVINHISNVWSYAQHDAQSYYVIVANDQSEKGRRKLRWIGKPKLVNSDMERG